MFQIKKLNLSKEDSSKISKVTKTDADKQEQSKEQEENQSLMQQEQIVIKKQKEEDDETIATSDVTVKSFIYASSNMYHKLSSE